MMRRCKTILDDAQMSTLEQVRSFLEARHRSASRFNSIEGGAVRLGSTDPGA
jgi:hypothetical protein